MSVVEPGAESFGQQVIRAPRVERGVVISRVGKTGGQAEERHDQQRKETEGGAREDERPPLDAQTEAIPYRIVMVRLARGKERDGQPVHPVAEDRQDGGQQGERGKHAHPNDHRRGRPQRAHERNADRVQSQHGDHDDDTGEEHRTPRRTDGDRHRILDGSIVVQALAEARDDEQ